MNSKRNKPESRGSRENKGEPRAKKSGGNFGGKFSKAKPDNGDLFAEGFSAVSEFLKAAPKKIEFIVSKPGDFEKVEAYIASLDLKKSPKHYLHDEWFDPDKHSHTPRTPVFAKLNLPLMNEDDFFRDEIDTGKAGALVLALDHVQDPQNFGAIARSAAFFGIRNILIPKARQVALTKTSVSISQGAFAYLNVVQVSNLNRAVKKLKEKQYWALGADMGGKTVEEVKGFYDNVVLILGNEGKGLSRLVTENCDEIVSISRECGELESLNVSVAAGILIYRLSK